MGFDIFSQPTGPTIDVNLYPNAVSAGIEQGNAQKTNLQAGIEGAIKGVQTGIGIVQGVQGIQQNANALQIQQHQIDQFPTTDKAAQAHADDAAAIAKIDELKAQEAAALQSTKILGETLQASADAKKAIQQQDTLKRVNQVTNILESSDPQTKGQLVASGQFDDLATSAPTVYEQLLKSQADNPTLNIDQKDRIARTLDGINMRKIDLEKQKIDEAHSALIGKDFEKIVNSTLKGDVPYLINNYGLGLSDLGNKSRVQTYPSGVKNFNKDGTLKAGPDNELSSLPVDANDGKFDVVIDGKRANVRIHKTENDAIQNLQHYMASTGLVSSEATPVATATPASTTTSLTPTSDAFERARGAPTAPTQNAGPPITAEPSPIPNMNIESNSSIVQQKAQELEARAQNDPILANRLVAKGLLKQQQVTVPATPTQTPEVRSSTPSANSSTKAGAENTPTPSPEVMKQNVSYVHDSLPTSAKRYVDKSTLTRVLDEPLVQGLKPIYQAVAAVESQGKKFAKAKGSSATGLFQLTDAAASDVKVDKTNPVKNVAGGVKYLDRLLGQFNDEEIPALMAYNIGPAVIRAAIDLTGSSDYDSLVFAMQYMKERGRTFDGVLTSSRIETAAKYPLKVLAYKEAFEALKSA